MTYARLVIYFAIVSVLLGVRAANAEERKIDVAAPVTTELAGKSAPTAFPSVLRVICTANDTGGTGFLHKSGNVVTAAHVVSPCTYSQLSLIFSSGQRLSVTATIVDSARDLAILRIDGKPSIPTLSLSSATELKVGDHVAAWGFPAGYRGLRPLLTVGYLAGEDRPDQKSPVQWVINAAFNRGNSGGPVVRIEDGAIIGVVSSKLAPLTPFIESALNVLDEEKYGMQFEKTLPSGEKQKVSEAQVVAEVLKYLRSQTQLVVGFAVKLGDLRSFLEENGIDP